MKTKQMTFRFRKDLMELVKAKAKAQHRSVNNYIESLLLREVGHIPNQETTNAIEAARDNIDLEPMEDVNSFFKEIEKEINKEQ